MDLQERDAGEENFRALTTESEHGREFFPVPPLAPPRILEAFPCLSPLEGR